MDCPSLQLTMLASARHGISYFAITWFNLRFQAQVSSVATASAALVSALFGGQVKLLGEKMTEMMQLICLPLFIRVRPRWRRAHQYFFRPGIPIAVVLVLNIVLSA